MKNAIIIGGGPAGLTAAYELLKHTDIHPVVYEMDHVVGGISKTINYKGNRMDLGGHRFFSKSDRVTEWWNEIMPLQGEPSYDDLLLHKDKAFSSQGPDPEKEDRVMLIRDRVSRILFLHKFFDYPISLKLQTFTNMGPWRTIKSGCGYLYSSIFKRKENSLEDFYINRFGMPLYNMFFEDYTEKVWGIHPSKLGADWGSQRVKGLSVTTVLKDMVAKKLKRNKDLSQKEIETSLIEQFVYPKYGPGQLWETVAKEIQDKSGEIVNDSEVTAIYVKDSMVTSVDIVKEGFVENHPCDYLLSSMPIKDLIAALRGIEIPSEVKEIAAQLPYRDFITVGLLIKKMKIKNQTKIATYDNRIPDTWVYVQERDVKIGRLQIFNNWSPYMVADYENTMFIGLEYFCTENDELWNMDDDEFIRMAVNELVKIDIIEPDAVIDATRIKVKKAYPAYYGSYYQLDKVRDFLNTIENLYCIGRNGQHHYNNMDHSMLTAMETVKNICNHISTKENIWSINTEEEYHESKK
ncbi:MAG: NAD(P)/FAD-dependent oxidoreductase [Bacteroidales bacterium]|nr:NAD(P)/FAD-dependent oxidoreductase [Bacteroidales bacterium]